MIIVSQEHNTNNLLSLRNLYFLQGDIGKISWYLFSLVAIIYKIGTCSVIADYTIFHSTFGGSMHTFIVLEIERKKQHTPNSSTTDHDE